MSDPTLYGAGKVHVPFFAVVGDQQEIIRPDGSVVAVVPIHTIDAILLELNTLLGEIV
jgi:hypothetical protein